MHVTKAVESMQADPIEGETVTLLVEVDDEYDPDGDPLETVEAAIEDTGAEVMDRRRFMTLVVKVAQDAIDDVLDVAGLAVVETDKAVTIDADGAGEDIEFER